MIRSEEELVDHCRIITLDDRWFIDEQGTTKGNRTKFTARALDESVFPIANDWRGWFWKASLPRYPIEFWSEVCAYQIGSVIGVEVPPCFPSLFHGQYGALSQMMIDTSVGQSLIHGGDLLVPNKPDYERVKGSDHSVQLVIRALQTYRFQNARLHRLVYPALFRQFLFDAIIGNSDRHQDNWGIVLQNSQDDPPKSRLSMLPAFDNGSSLGREISDGQLLEYLRDPNKLSRYIEKGKAHIRWEDGGNLKRVSHEALIASHVMAFPSSRAVVNRFLEFDMELVIRAICRVSSVSRQCHGVEITSDREELMVRLISERRSRLVAMMENL